MSAVDLFCLSGRHAVVTGGAQGIGLGIARGLAKAGARVLIIDCLPVDAFELAYMSQWGQKAQALQADFSGRQETLSAIQESLSILDGRVDILVNNAGIQHRADFPDYAVQAWDRVLEINLTTPFLFAQGFVPGMIQRQAGKIINIASIRSFIGSSQAVAYGVSKGGVLQLTRSLSNDLAPHGIQVNAIAPGFIHTNLTEDIRANPEVRQALLSRVPAGRLGQPADLAGAAIFLASSASDYVTGTTINCDGGFLSA